MTPRADKVQALLAPKNVAIVGASKRPGSWAQQVWDNLQRFDFDGPIFPVNPKYRELWGTSAYPDLLHLPEPPDHLVVLVPASQVAHVLREGARAGARSATVYASGFGEDGTESGQSRRQELHRVIAETGLAVSGPNCLGNLSAPARLVTITDRRLQAIAPGPVAVVGQSGGIVMAINRSLNDRGLTSSYMVTSGNEVGLTTADYIDFFVQDPQVRVVLAFMESVRQAEALWIACRRAQAARIPVVVLKIGGSPASRVAAQAHTGALAGSLAAFDAIAREVGIIRVESLDMMVEVAEFVAHAPLPHGGGLGAITFSGGFKGLILESAHRAHLALPTLHPSTERHLHAILGIGTAVGNPLDSGFTGLSDTSAYLECVNALLDDPGIDVILAQEELLRAPGNLKKEDTLRRLEALAAAPGQKPIAMISMISHSVTDYGRQLRTEFPHLPFLQEPGHAVRVVQSMMEYAQRLQTVEPWVNSASPTPTPRFSRGPEVRPIWDEVETKALLQQYGVPTPEEHLANSLAEARDHARSIGYPVVLKAVSPDIPHKTEAGAVQLDLRDDAAVVAAYQRILDNLQHHHPTANLVGVLVSPHLPPGLELALGIHPDPEVGPVVMFGAGGIGLEVDPDVSFGPPQLNRRQARELIERTRVSQRLAGIRGQPPYDVPALENVLMAIGRLAADLAGTTATLDLNPLWLGPLGQGAVCLDALLVWSPTAT